MAYPGVDSGQFLCYNNLNVITAPEAGESFYGQDAQFATTTLYVSTTMNGAESMFGVNFADGRINGYPIGPMPGQTEDTKFYVYYVRGSDDYGINDFEDNQDETISDNATGLMWSQNDSAEGLNWEEALDWIEQKNSENYQDLLRNLFIPAEVS